MSIKAWGLPSELKIELIALVQELDKFEEKDVNSWGTDDKVAYWQDKMDLLRNFLNKYKNPSESRSTLRSANSVREEPKITNIPSTNESRTLNPITNNPPKSPRNINPPPTSVPVPEPVSNNPPPPTSSNTDTSSSSDSSAAVKSIMNQVFRKVKAQAIPGTTYTGANVIDMVKNLIIETTVSVSSTSSPEEQATIKQIMNNVFKTVKGNFQPDSDVDGQEVLDSVKQTIVKITNDLLQSNTPPVSNAPTNTAPITNKQTQVRQSNLERAQSVRDGESSVTSAGIEVQRRDAEARINRNPSDKDVDLNDQDVLEAYIRVRNDNDPTRWVIYGYGSSKNRLQVYAEGEGGFDDLEENMPEDIPVYAYFKFLFGDTSRSKFIFITYVPESLNGLQKSRVLAHRHDVTEFIKYMHLTMHLQDFGEFTEENLIKMLLQAGGANYSVQEENKGNFSGYKSQTKSFYEETEKKGTKISIAYDNRPLALTPIDISGRPTVASKTEFLSNTKF